jgi:hypothetical protein
VGDSIKKTIEAPGCHHISWDFFDIAVNAFTLADTAPHGWTSHSQNGFIEFGCVECGGNEG